MRLSKGGTDTIYHGGWSSKMKRLIMGGQRCALVTEVRNCIYTMTPLSDVVLLFIAIFRESALINQALLGQPADNRAGNKCP